MSHRYASRPQGRVWGSARRWGTAVLGISMTLAASAQDSTATDPQKAKTLEGVQVVGSRAKDRTAAETPAPVDVIGRDQLESAGVVEVGQALQMLEPSFNFSRTFVSDGTDTIRPATLRGLGPDQVLVQVNGKRRHQQALVNVQQTIGRGSAGTDINAIPISAIERIEVLRDGAAAQYGSDAISGVINIVLKKQVGETTGSVTAGKTYKGDGFTRQVGINTGLRLGHDGYLNLTAEYRHRDPTNRAGVDSLRVDPPRVTQKLGDADTKDAYFWLNGGLPIAKGELYWFGGISQRKGNSYGFFRPAGDNRTSPALYPNGFLPNIATNVKDASLAVGYRGPLGDKWDYDISLNHGRSQFGFDERNSANVSWWYEPRDPANPATGIYASSPTTANTGTLRLNETTFNADVRGPIDWGVGHDALNLAMGFEWRRDSYQILPGDPVSYTYGRTDNRGIPIYGQTGDIAQPGMQGFPGFSPNEAVNLGRHNIAFYVDAESQVTQRLLLGAAVRHEHYSDFGGTTTGKVSLRFDANDSFAVRGTLATGFRAPGVQQLFYSPRSTNLDPSGKLTDTLTARQDSAVTRAFGIQPLKQETSHSGTAGIVYKPGNDFTLTVDVFRIDIKNRIIFSSNIVPESVGTDGNPCAANNANCPIRAILAPFGVGQVLFFTNAIDTRTKGIDVVAEKGFRFDDSSTLDLTALLNYNKTDVTKRKSQSTILPPDKLFDDTQVTLIEQGQPRVHHILQGVYRTGPWDFTLRGNYFGPVSGQGFTPGVIQTWSGKWLADVALGYRFSRNLKLTVGADNVFDTYPDQWDPKRGAPFPQLGFVYGWETLPFGVNGGYYYARLDFKF